MSALEKTETLERMSVPIHDLVPNEMNPNEMSDAEFNLLYDNMEQVGLTDPILVRRKPDGVLEIVGGHHRWEVAKLLGFEDVPCTVITDESFDDDAARFQMVRHNVIKGKMSPQKFMALYEQMSEKYTDEILKDSFGFANEEEFRKLIARTAKELPPEIKDQFLKGAEEIKTIDGLSALLNKLFSTYGDTLPFGYMLIDFGGKESIWLRLGYGRLKDFKEIGELCRENNRTMDDLVGGLIHMVVEGKLDEQVEELVMSTKEVEIPMSFKGMPTKDALSNADHDQEEGPAT